LGDGWIDFPRPKTGIARRCPLWPETVAAVRAVLTDRPVAKDKADADLVFLLRSGRRWVRNTEKSRTDNISVVFCELLKACGLYRDGLGFYTLRHVFRTVADAARDPVAIDLIMGHTDPSMGGHYRERIDDSRLRAVADHVRTWLFSTEPDGGKGGKGDTPVDPPSGEGDREPDRKGDENCVISDRSVSAEEGDARPTLRLFVG
jgi:hypothetical protein